MPNASHWYGNSVEASVLWDNDIICLLDSFFTACLHILQSQVILSLSCTSCVCACMEVCPLAYVYVHCAPHVWMFASRAESERLKPLMFSPSRFQRNFIVNGAQKCTCLQAVQGFGISLPLCAGSCMPLVVCLVCACIGYVKRRAIYFNH